MKEIALITGASSGIGYEIAKLIAADKTDLLIVARSEKKLLEIKKEFEENWIMLLKNSWLQKRII